ncbi:YhjD/YihY/BrkB family envelope integrity protein [Hippea maritima]|uniref:Ribonuclease BN n=1 Tax=Hippea maritima (strain ATCC 700847 / DSM 10411 / MH2) TaxID=760142 RepID=F2LUT2_HIPMA|nr:YhjD/YihY/BrkB family envelope integrity protein [Hippea maritima]AEA33537.1 ribonuclease BN [Hippea maritima DSM 10411]
MPFFDIKEALRIYKERQVLLWSAFLTYLTVLNIVPFVYFSIFVLSHLPFVSKKIPYFKGAIINIVPAYSAKVSLYFDTFLKSIASMELLNSIIFSLSMMSLVLGFFKAIRYILGVEKKINIFKTFGFVLLSIIAVGVIITIAVALRIVIPVFMPKIADAVYVRLLPFFIWFVFLFALFYITKPRELKFLNVIVASFVTTVGVFLLKAALAAYFSIFSYSKIYGAVAIVPSLLLWLFLLWNVILFGVVVAKVIKI